MRLELPFPVSVNSIWKKSKHGMYRSKAYEQWEREADVLLLKQKAEKTVGKPVEGHFTYSVVLDQSKRKSNMDGDNFGSKVILDYLQRVGLIENDSMADSGSWSWGPVDGCVVTVHRSLIQRAA